MMDKHKQLLIRCVKRLSNHFDYLWYLRQCRLMADLADLFKCNLAEILQLGSRVQISVNVVAQIGQDLGSFQISQPLFDLRYRFTFLVRRTIQEARSSAWSSSRLEAPLKSQP